MKDIIKDLDIKLPVFTESEDEVVYNIIDSNELSKILGKLDSKCELSEDNSITDADTIDLSYIYQNFELQVYANLARDIYELTIREIR